MASKNQNSKEVVGSFNLGTTGENSFASQDSQEPTGARRLLSFIPNVSGDLKRELGQALYLPTQLPSNVGALTDYQYNNVAGVLQSKRFAATATQLYMEVGGAWVAQSLPVLATGLTTTSPFNDYPQFCIINNLLHIADGTANWIYDGPNAQFIVDGFIIPPFPPNMVNNGLAGTFTCLVGRYYWMTYADETVGRVHESSSSAISGSTGPVTNKSIQVNANNILVTTVNGSKNIVATSGAFTSAMVGMKLYVNGTDMGVLATFTDATHMILVSNAPANNTGQSCIIAPPRATHIHFYGSETDGSKLGKFLVSIPVTNNPSSIIDQNPFITDPTSTISNVDRPIRNDPPPGGKILEVHKYRIFRRRETKPNFFLFSGNEEISAGNGNGSPQESYPGASGTSTVSDMVDEQSYPQESNRLRALCSHSDAMWLGTEKSIIPLYGNSIDDFGLMQIVTITGGVISRWGMNSTSHGLTIFQYDRLFKNYPPISPVYSVVPQDLNVTDQLVEIGRPMRNKFKAIKSSDQDNVRTLHYHVGERDWSVVCLQDSSNVYHTYVYDWATKSWFESQRGFVSVAVFEPTAGTRILVGGGTDGFVYVMDDLSGTFTNATCPAALYRTALINFARPDIMHEPESLEFEVSNPALADNITVNFYLDPQDADNPGTPLGPMKMELVRNSAARYRGYFAATEGVTGVTCKRLMVEFSVAASTNQGALRGLLLKSNPVDEESI